MAGSIADYVKTHNLARKYGLGVGLVAIAALVSFAIGDSPGIVLLKTMIAIPFATISIILPAIFDPVRSRTPFTPSFLERSALEAFLSGLALALLLWSPVNHPLLLITVSASAFAIYFGGRLLLAQLTGR